MTSQTFSIIWFLYKNGSKVIKNSLLGEYADKSLVFNARMGSSSQKSIIKSMVLAIEGQGE